MPNPFIIANLAINSSTWTPVIAPFHCSYVSIKNVFNLADIIIATDLDPGDTDVIVPGVLEIISSHWEKQNTKNASRFLKDSIICYLKCSFGSGDTKIRFID